MPPLSHLLSAFASRCLTEAHQAARILWRAINKYVETDGEQRAAAFAYYALFALLPLVVLCIALGTRFLGTQAHAEIVVLSLLGEFLPKDVSASPEWIATVERFMRVRLRAEIISAVVLFWSGFRFFQSLMQGVTRAWGTPEHPWWQLPFKNILMLLILASAMLIGVVAPVVVTQVEYFYTATVGAPKFDFGLGKWAFGFVRWALPPALLWYGLLLFYKFAPRRRTRLKEVWMEALVITLALRGLQELFVDYTQRFADFNALYGTFSSVVALMLWVYLSGSLIIFGGCICSARAEVTEGFPDQAEPEPFR